MKGLLGKNLGMTQKFDEKGDVIPVTVIKCGPCTVVQKKTREKEGYSALQLGFEEVKKLQRVNRPRKGHFQKAKTGVYRYLGECRLENIEDINVGDQIGVEIFEIGDFLHIRGKSKGRGFQGVIKRHGKSGGGASHGSHFHRAPGSIGMCADPAKVIKNMKMPGHMGSEFVTVKNLKLVEVDIENNLLFVKGSVPGSRNGLVNVAHAAKVLSDRIKKPFDKAQDKQEAGDKKQENMKPQKG